MKINPHDKFKRFRKQIGLTQEQLAERLGITRARVANYENRSKVPFELAKKLEQEFGGQFDRKYFRPDWP